MQIFEILPHGRQGPIHLSQPMPTDDLATHRAAMVLIGYSWNIPVSSKRKGSTLRLTKYGFPCLFLYRDVYNAIWCNLRPEYIESSVLGFGARPNHTCLIVCHCRIMLNGVSGIEKERKMRKSPISWNKNGGGCRRTVLQWLRNKS